MDKELKRLNALHDAGKCIACGKDNPVPDPFSMWNHCTPCADMNRVGLYNEDVE